MTGERSSTSRDWPAASPAFRPANAAETPTNRDFPLFLPWLRKPSHTLFHRNPALSSQRSRAARSATCTPLRLQRPSKPTGILSIETCTSATTSSTTSTGLTDRFQRGTGAGRFLYLDVSRLSCVISPYRLALRHHHSAACLGVRHFCVMGVRIGQSI